MYQYEHWILKNAPVQVLDFEEETDTLKVLQGFNVKRVHAFGDSLLVVSQVNAEWQVKDSKLIPYQKIALAHIGNFEEFQLNHVKREYNHIADGLACLGSLLSFKDSESCRSFEIGRLDQPAFIPAEQVNQATQKEKPCYQDIKNFIETGEFPSEMPRKEQRAIQRMSARYFILADTLYHRGFSSEYTRCLDKDETMEVV